MVKGTSTSRVIAQADTVAVHDERGPGEDGAGPRPTHRQGDVAQQRDAACAEPELVGREPRASLDRARERCGGVVVRIAVRVGEVPSRRLD